MSNHCYYTLISGGWQEFKEEILKPTIEYENNVFSLRKNYLPQQRNSYLHNCKNKQIRMRTIEEAFSEISSADGNTAITKNFIRTLIVSGKVPSVKAGKKYLVNMDTLYDYLYNGEIKTATCQSTPIRKVDEKVSRTTDRKRGVC